MLLERVVARVDHLQQEVGVGRLLERRAERREQVLREIADEPHRVGEDDLALAPARPAAPQGARARIEGREELVLREHVGARERVEQRALAGVRVADDRHRGHAVPRALATALLALLAELLQLVLEVRHPVLRAPAPDLELGLAGTAPADAAGEAREAVVLLPEPRHRVLQLRELHLQLAVSTLGALREDVENELRPVDDLQVGHLGDRARLRRRKLAIEDEDVGVELDGAHDDLFELALAHHEPGIDVRAHLDDRVRRLDPRRACELAELAHALLGLPERLRPAGLVAHVHQDGAPVLGLDHARPRAPRELRFEVAHQPADVDVRLGDGHGPDLPVGGAAVGARDVVRLAERARLAPRCQLDGGDEIEPQAHQIDPIVVRQRLAAQVRVHEAQAAEAALRGAQAPDVRQHQLGRVTDDDRVDRARSVDEHADLPARLERDRRERPRQLGRRDVVERARDAGRGARERAASTAGDPPCCHRLRWTCP